MATAFTAELRSHGARLRAALPRYLTIAVLLLLLCLGARSLLPASPAPAPPSPPALADAPSRHFALQFARAYLTYDSERPGARARALSPFISDALDGDAGFFAPSGSQGVRWVQIASDQPALTGGRAITVAAALSTQALPVYLTVTVAHERDGVVLVGYPAFVGAPALSARSPAAAREAVEDAELAAVVERVLRNYLAGSAPNLRADLAPGASVTLPTLALRVRSIERIEWIGGAGSGAVLATASAVDERAAAYTLAYELGIAQRERPYVDFIEVIPTAG